MDAIPYVEIEFLRVGASGPVTLRLSAAEYFDPPDEVASNAVPKFLNPHEYLDVAPVDLLWCIVREYGTESGTVQRYQYMKDGRSWVAHTINKGGWQTLVASTWVSPTVENILNLHLASGDPFWTVDVDCVFDHSNNVGLELTHDNSPTPKDR
jgi:hypothetical protein